MRDAPRTIGQTLQSNAASDSADVYGYLGHLADNGVLQEGHNTGMKPKGIAMSKDMAKRGYRTLPGSAVTDQGHARFGEADHGLPRPKRVTDDEYEQMKVPVPPSVEPGRRFGTAPMSKSQADGVAERTRFSPKAGKLRK